MPTNVINSSNTAQNIAAKPVAPMMMNHHHHHHQHHHHQPSFQPKIPVTAQTPTVINPQVESLPPMPSLSTTTASSNQSQSSSSSSSSSLAPQMPKSVYDSLAPLDIPSKPVVYVEETNTTTSSTAAATASTTSANETTATSNTASEESSREERAKLESILLGKMMEKGTAAGMMMMDGPSGSSSGPGMPNSHHSHMANRFLGMNKWPRNNMLSQAGQAALISNLANRPLPPNYVCTICKKPGHHKQLCPEAVSRLSS